METQIFIIIAITGTVGVLGGWIAAIAFELPDQRALRKELRRTKRALRHERRMRKITTINS